MKKMYLFTFNENATSRQMVFNGSRLKPATSMTKEIIILTDYPTSKVEVVNKRDLFLAFLVEVKNI